MTPFVEPDEAPAVPKSTKRARPAPVDVPRSARSSKPRPPGARGPGRPLIGGAPLEVRLTIRVSQGEAAAFRALAAEKGRSLGAVLRGLISKG